jgi:hypothetical protein
VLSGQNRKRENHESMADKQMLNVAHIEFSMFPRHWCIMEIGLMLRLNVSVSSKESPPVPDGAIVLASQCTAHSESRALSSESPW